MERENKNKFWKGVLVGALVTAFAGLVIVGVATLISLVGRTVIDNQTRTQIVQDSRRNNKDDVEHIDMEHVQKKVETLESYIDNFYLFDKDNEKLEDGIYQGLMSGLEDPYSVYYTVDAYQKMKESTEGKYCGIGAMVSQNAQTGIITIVRVFEGSPSEEAGLLPGDIIYKVEEEEVTGFDLDLLVSEHIRGLENTKVNITVLRANDYQELSITRREIEVPTVEHKMLADNTGYVMVSQFDIVTPSQFIEAIEDLEEQGMERLVIDLRGNPGGVLDTVVEMAAYILPEDRMEGMIVYTEDKNEKGAKYFCKDGKIQMTSNDGSGTDSRYPKQDGHQLDIPIAVLINGNSASASEVFAGCMKDYEWATLVGTTTFGKGIVQHLIPLSDGTAIKLTTSHYFTPDGFDLHGKGIEPDVEIELDEELRTKVTVEPEDDNQLQKAIEVLKDSGLQ
ncbi:MAG: S41 family peptidase [Lachnospiraceae bacterium]